MMNEGGHQVIVDMLYDYTAVSAKQNNAVIARKLSGISKAENFPPILGVFWSHNEQQPSKSHTECLGSLTGVCEVSILLG